MDPLSAPHPSDSVIEKAQAGALQLTKSFRQVSSFSSSLTVLHLGSSSSRVKVNNELLSSLVYPAVKLQELGITTPASLDTKEKTSLTVNPQRYPHLQTLHLDGVHLEGDLSTLRYLCLAHHPGGLLNWSSCARMLNTATHLQTLKLIRYSVCSTAYGAKLTDDERIAQLPLIVRLPHLTSLALRAMPKHLATTLSYFPNLPTMVLLQADCCGGIEEIIWRGMNIFSQMLSSGLSTGLPPAFKRARNAELSFRDDIRLTIAYPDNRILQLHVDLPWALGAPTYFRAASASASSSSVSVSVPAPDPVRLAAMYNAVLTAAAWTCTGAPITTFKCIEVPDVITEDTWAFFLRALDFVRNLAVSQRPRVPGQSILSLFRAMAKFPIPTAPPAPAHIVPPDWLKGPWGLNHVQVRGTEYSAELLETVLEAVRAQRLQNLELQLSDALTFTGKGEPWFKGESNYWEHKLGQLGPNVTCASVAPYPKEEYDRRVAAVEQAQAQAMARAMAQINANAQAQQATR